MELKNAKYQFRSKISEFKIPNQNWRIVKRCIFYVWLKLSQLRSMLIFYTNWKHQKSTNVWFSGGIKGNIDPKWVKQQQYRRERQNLMLLAWNACSSIVKQKYFKNKTTWLTQIALSKSFSLHWNIKIII